jgi:glycosyltransferase involved in cell wall biosynthesis
MGIEDLVGNVPHPENTVTQEKQGTKVSIGIPVYNGEPFIRETLDSLISQTFTNFELIISDNASTDGTEAICREYAAKDARIRYERQPKNFGGFSNFELVLAYAKSDYFMWIAGDDCFAGCDDLNNLYEKIKLGYEYAFPDVSIIDRHRNVVKENLMNPFKYAKTRFDYAQSAIEVSSHQMYALFKTSSLRNYFSYLKKHKNLACYGEGLFVHVISIKLNGIFVPEACKLYRIHEHNNSRTQRIEALIPSFLEYSRASLHFMILSEDLNINEKTLIVSKKISKSIHGLLRLFLALIFRKLLIFSNQLKS